MEWLEGHPEFLRLGACAEDGDVELTWEVLQEWVTGIAARIRRPGDLETVYSQERQSSLAAARMRSEKGQQRLREYEALVTGCDVSTPGAFGSHALVLWCCCWCYCCCAVGVVALFSHPSRPSRVIRSAPAPTPSLLDIANGWV